MIATLPMVLLVVAILVLVWIPLLATSGTSRRAVYLAGVVVWLLLGLGCFAILPTSRDVARAQASDDAAQAAGAQALFVAGPAVGMVWFAASLGCLLGVILYRPRP